MMCVAPSQHAPHMMSNRTSATRQGSTSLANSATLTSGSSKEGTTTVLCGNALQVTMDRRAEMITSVRYPVKLTAPVSTAA